MKCYSMNLTVWAYCIYLIITILITVFVGWACHKNGIHFIIDCVEDIAIAHSINNLLLVGYYLLNIGYAILTVTGWQSIDSLPELFDVLTFRLAIIILTLALTHYVNMLVLNAYPAIFNRKQIKT